MVRKNVSTHVGMYPFHDDLEKDVVLCATCVSQERKSNLALSSKKEDAFLSTGYSNWKKALQKFRTHESSNCHLEALCQLYEKPMKNLIAMGILCNWLLVI